MAKAQFLSEHCLLTRRDPIASHFDFVGVDALKRKREKRSFEAKSCNLSLICEGFGLHITFLTSSNQITKREVESGPSNPQGKAPM
ncbi:hypothetical protein L1987_00288 [Smallanthus sonchifolius]|uniref:Uncharacterized protein n=1 Tax=Smallanthus sonchifolius TaxID=185202 RepID=A0ACB9K1T2_9ASTR|nr:hypothetical protein L1987_00288 [Smallanthus sonchifolius]